MKLLLPILILIMLYPSNISSQSLPGDGNEIEDTSLFEFLKGRGGGSLQEYMENVLEVEIEDPNRKASTDKFMGDWSSLPDMELYYTPHFDISPWNFDWPDLPPIVYGYGSWPDRDPPRFPDDPGTGWYLFGCWISCFPKIIDCTREDFECVITTSQAIAGVEIKGQVLGWEWDQKDPNILIVYPSPQAVDGTHIDIKVCTKPLNWQEKSGCCEESLHVQCGEECLCVEESTMYITGSETITRNNSQNYSATSLGLGCPPYTWSLVHDDCGKGHTITSSDTTNADGETITVSADGTACGGFCLEVIDQCGTSTDLCVRNTSAGTWRLKKSGAADGADGCGFPGPWTNDNGVWREHYEGYKRQQQQNTHLTQIDDCGTLCDDVVAGCADSVECVDCVTGYKNSSICVCDLYPVPCVCSGCYRSPPVDNWCYACVCVTGLRYYEWECIVCP